MSFKILIKKDKKFMVIAADIATFILAEKVLQQVKKLPAVKSAFIVKG